MRQLFKRIKKFYKNQSYEEEKVMKIMATIFIILLLLITPIITHYKNVYWAKQYEEADERKEALKNAVPVPSPGTFPSPTPTVSPEKEDTNIKEQR